MKPPNSIRPSVSAAKWNPPIGMVKTCSPSPPSWLAPGAHDETWQNTLVDSSTRAAGEPGKTSRKLPSMRSAETPPV